MSRVLEHNYSLHYLVGSVDAGRYVNPPKSTYVSLDQLNIYLANPKQQGTVDVVEIFGGNQG